MTWQDQIRAVLDSNMTPRAKQEIIDLILSVHHYMNLPDEDEEPAE